MSESDPPVSTGSGDDGTTNLLGAGRLAKDDERVALLGDVDEASPSLGIAHAEAEDAETKELLLELQRLLYRLMGDVAMPEETNTVGPEDVTTIDEALEEWRERPEIPDEFVVPGESKLGAHLDLARSVVRRVERGMVAAGLVQDHPHALEVVNRLSDLLFVVARNADGGVTPSRGNPYRLSAAGSKPRIGAVLRGIPSTERGEAECFRGCKLAANFREAPF